MHRSAFNTPSRHPTSRASLSTHTQARGPAALEKDYEEVGAEGEGEGERRAGSTLLDRPSSAAQAASGTARGRERSFLTHTGDDSRERSRVA